LLHVRDSGPILDPFSVLRRDICNAQRGVYYRDVPLSAKPVVLRGSSSYVEIQNVKIVVTFKRPWQSGEGLAGPKDRSLGPKGRSGGGILGEGAATPLPTS